MTLPVSTIVNVAIDRQTLFPQGPGFGTLLVIIPDTGIAGSGLDAVTNRVGTYTSADAVGTAFGGSSEVYKAAVAYFSQNPRPVQLKVGVRDATPSGTLTDELNGIAAVDDDWYGFIFTAGARVSEDAGAAAILASQWAETRTKLFLTATNESAALAGGGGLPATFKTLGYDRSGIFYHQDADADVGNSYPEAAFFGAMLTVDFNGVNTTRTGKFRRLRGISTSPLNSSQLAFLQNNNANAYVSIANTPMSLDGVMASGEFFDTMHGIDWLSAEIQFRVFGKLATLPKVPYTDQGMEILLAQVRLALQQGVKNGLLAPQIDDDGNIVDAFEVSAPSVLTASEANRSARIAPTITFTARLAGAVHRVQINGTVTI